MSGEDRLVDLFGLKGITDLEAEILAAGAAFPDQARLVLDELDRRDFQKPFHQRLFDLYIALTKAGYPLALALINEELEAKDGYEAVIEFGDLLFSARQPWLCVPMARRLHEVREAERQGTDRPRLRARRHDGLKL